MSDAPALHPDGDRRISSGEQIRLIRKRKGIKAETLAAALGVHRNTITRWEDPNERSEPSISQGVAIAKVLGCRVEEIAGGLLLSPQVQRPDLRLLPGGRRATVVPAQRTFDLFRTLAPVE